MADKREVHVHSHVRQNPNSATKPVSIVREHARTVETSAAKGDKRRSAANTVGNRMGLQDVAEDGAEQAPPKPLDEYRLQTARMWLVNAYPFYARLLYRMPTVESRETQTFAVDKYGRIYINPDYANDLPTERYAAALVHELNHFIRGHHERMPGGTLGNLAGDCEINDDIKKAKGLDADPNWIYPTDSFGLPEDQTAEYYFNNIPRETHTCPDCKRQKTKFVFVGKDKVAEEANKGKMG
jgi:rubredoxin